MRCSRRRRELTSALFGHLLAKDGAANAVALPLKLVLESFDKDIQIAAHP